MEDIISSGESMVTEETYLIRFSQIDAKITVDL